MSQKTTHIERTAAEPRSKRLVRCTLTNIRKGTPAVRLLTLVLHQPIKFLPGQWVDLHIPTLRSPGGFTITSAPHTARAYNHAIKRPVPSNTVSTSSERGPEIELAVQRTLNPPARWLWQPCNSILGTELEIQTGGSFTWPPPGIDASSIERVVFVAGGVGINPFMSMLTAMAEGPLDEVPVPRNVVLLYSSRAPGEASDEPLFAARLGRLVDAIKKRSGQEQSLAQLHLTTVSDWVKTRDMAGEMHVDGLEIKAGRIQDSDVEMALGPIHGRSAGRTVAYACGPGPMVDELSKKIGEADGMSKDSVFVEKWW